MSRGIVCVDFDGVLHWYRNGWKGVEVIDDEPTPGAREWLEEWIRHHYDDLELVIYSSRCSDPKGVAAIEAWLRKHNFPDIRVTATKPAAIYTLDDRCERFSGVFPTFKSIKEFKPWNK